MAASKRGSEERSPSPSGTRGQQGMTTIVEQLRQSGVSAADLLSTPAFQSWLESLQTEAALGEETDVIARAFGTLAEGLRLNGNTTDRVRQLLRDRFERRRNYANYTRFPEGFIFLHLLPGDNLRWVVLLTPPDQVAIRHPNGTWSRRRRVEEEDGPAPYTQQWYQEYLRSRNLPSWFLSYQHTACLIDDAEDLWLGRPRTAVLPPLPADDYLEAMYPELPFFPYPAPRAYGGQEYSYKLSGLEQERVARHFPATRTLGSDDHIVVLPSGHIVVRHAEAAPAPFTCPSGSMGWLSQSDHHAPSSYITEGAPLSPTAVESADDLANTSYRRAAAVTRARGDGGYINLPSVPRGPGHWEWLEDGVDQVRAQRLGFNSQEEVTRARQASILAHGIGRNAGPLVVWFPDVAFTNPVQQPRGAGRWAFMTDEAEEMAIVNFGGQAGFGLGNVPRPSAHDIFLLRGRLQDHVRRNEIDDDLTEDIELVWIPATPEPGLDNAESEDEGAGRPNTAQDRDLGFGFDVDTGLAHEPTNRGENDQTGDSQAHYQSRMLPVGSEEQQKYTVDRSTSQFTKSRSSQHHKEWVLTKKAKWVQYDKKKLAAINWSQPSDVEKLNKWRNQRFTREDWPAIRKESRVEYTEAQRKWMMQRITAARGRPSGTSEAWTKSFNKQFKTQRPTAGIASLVERLVKQFFKEREEEKEQEPDLEEGEVEVEVEVEEEVEEQPPRKKQRQLRPRTRHGPNKDGPADNGEPNPDGSEEDHSEFEP